MDDNLTFMSEELLKIENDGLTVAAPQLEA